MAKRFTVLAGHNWRGDACFSVYDTVLSITLGIGPFTSRESAEQAIVRISRRPSDV